MMDESDWLVSKLGDRPTVLVHRVTSGTCPTYLPELYYTYRIDLTIRVRQPQRCAIN